MNITKLITLTIALFPAFHSFAYALKVDIPKEYYSLQYPEPARLDTILMDVVTNSKSNQLQVYPLANQLFNLTKDIKAQQLKTEVLDSLKQLHQSYRDDQKKTSIKMLIEQIEQWKVGYREFISLDLDQVRIDPTQNPLLNGEYEFIVQSRSNQIHLTGLLRSPTTITFSPARTLSDVMDRIQTLPSSSNSYAWVVYPDGHYIKAGHAYWNNQNTNLTPGSFVFVGFNSNTPEFEALEENIVKLISMRKEVQ